MYIDFHSYILDSARERNPLEAPIILIHLKRPLFHKDVFKIATAPTAAFGYEKGGGGQQPQSSLLSPHADICYSILIDAVSPEVDVVQ